MKTIKRANALEKVKHRGKTFLRLIGDPIAYGPGVVNDNRYLKVMVLPSRMKNKTDLRGRNYTPSSFLYKQL